MNDRSRRQFIKSVALVPMMIQGMKEGVFAMGRKLPPLSFSTLGCPDWPFDKILEFAAANGYQGIEVRGISREMDLPKSPIFSSPAAISETLGKMKEKGLRFVDLGSSCELHHADEAVRQKNLEEGKRFIDLAQQVHCPFVRVFPNKLPKEEEKSVTMARITMGLIELGKYAEGKGVTVLMETHGDLSASKDVEAIMNVAGSREVALVWDIVNMWSVTKEPPADVYARLKKWIRHTHIKDLKWEGEKERYVFLGKGQTPVFEAIDLLYKSGYKGFYSFEWEKMWHPEIEEPEVALADYPVAMKSHFGG